MPDTADPEDYESQQEPHGSRTGGNVRSWPVRTLAGPITADPYDALTPTGRNILEAAHRVLRQEGFAGLSVGAVAKAAGENKSTIIYHFGDKAGLLTALTDSLVFKMRSGLLPYVESMSTRQPRAQVLFDVHLKIARDSEYWKTLYDLLPHITRDRRLHARFSALMDWYYEVILRALGLYDEGGDNEEGNLIASLALAVLEGFAMQRLLMGPRGFDVNARYRLWERLFTPFVEECAALRSEGEALAGEVAAPQGTSEPGDVVATGEPASASGPADRE